MEFSDKIIQIFFNELQNYLIKNYWEIIFLRNLS